MSSWIDRCVGRLARAALVVAPAWVPGVLLAAASSLPGLGGAGAQELAPVQVEEVSNRPSPPDQLRSGFADLLWGGGGEDATAALVEKVLGPIFRELEVRGTQVSFVDDANPAGAITASRPSHESSVVVVAINKKQIVASHPDAAERVEMTWFALLHELQNALRAKEFRELALKGWRGEISEEEFVRGELSTEWDSLSAAYEVYVRVLWPELETLGHDRKWRVQREYAGIESLKKEDAVSRHMKGPMGAYYRERYVEYQRERERRRAKKEG